MSLTPDGIELLLVSYDEDSSRTEIYSTRLELAGFMDGWQISPSRRRDSAPLLLGSDQGEKVTTLGVVDDYFEIGHSWQEDGLAWWIISGSP